jgi:hypothetical protein
MKNSRYQRLTLPWTRLSGDMGTSAANHGANLFENTRDLFATHQQHHAIGQRAPPWADIAPVRITPRRLDNSMVAHHFHRIERQDGRIDAPHDSIARYAISRADGSVPSAWWWLIVNVR